MAEIITTAVALVVGFVVGFVVGVIVGAYSERHPKSPDSLELW